MSETATVPATPTPSKAKKTKATPGKAKKPTSTHPPVAEMVSEAIAALKEKNGSSSQAIKKYIAVHYKVDVDKLAPFIKKSLKSAVTSGSLIQTKGKGASGSFKIAKDAKVKKIVKPKPKPKEGASPKPKKTPIKKVKKAPKPKASPKKVKKEVKPKEKVSKVEKKPKASKAAKPKTPKKKAATKPKKAAKKATPKK